MLILYPGNQWSGNTALTDPAVQNRIAKLPVTRQHHFGVINTRSDKPMQIMPPQNTHICRTAHGNFYLYMSLKLSPKETQVSTHLLCKISEKSELRALLTMGNFWLLLYLGVPVPVTPSLQLVAEDITQGTSLNLCLMQKCCRIY